MLSIQLEFAMDEKYPTPNQKYSMTMHWNPSCLQLSCMEFAFVGAVDCLYHLESLNEVQGRYMWKPKFTTLYKQQTVGYITSCLLNT